jgi:hypothetical protein
MKRLVLLVAIAALAVPGGALAKGPTKAVLQGPGLANGITFAGYEGTGRLGELTEEAGFFPAAFGQEPSPMLAERPTGDLGPRYTITYTVPGGSNERFVIRQDLYPYALPSPVAYMAPGQPIFGMASRGGWFRAEPALKAALVEAGLPASRTSATPGGWSLPTKTVAVCAALLILAVVAFLLRRRHRPAARMAGSPG